MHKKRDGVRVCQHLSWGKKSGHTWRSQRKGLQRVSDKPEPGNRNFSKCNWGKAGKAKPSAMSTRCQNSQHGPGTGGITQAQWGRVVKPGQDEYPGWGIEVGSLFDTPFSAQHTRWWGELIKKKKKKQRIHKRLRGTTNAVKCIWEESKHSIGIFPGVEYTRELRTAKQSPWDL